MATYFDPKAWASFTTAWLEPATDFGVGAVTALMPDVLMTLLSEGILSQFGGKEVSATLLGHEMRATLQTLKVRRRGAHFQTKTVLTGLRWNRHPVDEVTVIAHGVRLIPGVPTKVRAAQLDLTGAISVAALLEWINGWQTDWELEPAEGGLVLARHRRRRIRALADAEISDNVLTIRVHRAHWRKVPAPRRMTKLDPILLSDLPNQARIARAERVGDKIHFTADLPAMTGSFDLAQIRAAIVAGTTLIIF
ncbi:hypothetical protein ACIP5Y_32350 [Nocardia sp. NPDC088792]|uniref:hypothetical protein n=1 Tax=Nocardia sp. NPDC088792 TaxID=3364332 RepID=UPI0037FA9718